MENSYIIYTDKKLNQSRFEQSCLVCPDFDSEHTPVDSKNKSFVTSDSSLIKIISLWHYYMHTNNVNLTKNSFLKAKKLIDCILSEGTFCSYLESSPADFIFMEGADVEKNGIMCYKQILFLNAIQSMGFLSEALDFENKYCDFANSLKKQLFFDFWDGVYGFRHCDNECLPSKYGNIFAIVFGYLKDNPALHVINNSLKSPSVSSVTSSDMKFFEACAECKCHQGSFNDYKLTSNQGYYVLKNYFVGLRPVAAGFKQFEICPEPEDFKCIEGCVSAGIGNIEFYLSDNKIKISCPDGAKGVLVINKNKVSEKYGFLPYSDDKYKLEFDGSIDIDL